MTDNVQRIIARLDEAEEKKHTRRKMLRESLDTCHRLEEEYDEALRTETDPEKYNDLMLKSEENKNRYTALLRQRNQKEAPALSRQEYEAIRKDLKDELTAIQAQHAPAIIDALKTLIPLVNAYAEDLEELERIRNGAQRLTGVIGFSATMDPSTIKEHAPEELADVLTAFIHDYWLNQGVYRTYKGD